MATDDHDKLDPKVKDFIDAATRAELERWFGLPSYEVAGQKAEPSPEDPEMVAVRERREKAIAAVDPVLLEALRARFEDGPASLIQFKESIKLRIDETVPLFDYAMVERQASIADPREVEISEELRDDLKDCTPQALLRDLHRIDFDKTFEIVDMAAGNGSTSSPRSRPRWPPTGSYRRSRRCRSPRRVRWWRRWSPSDIRRSPRSCCLSTCQTVGDQ
ncbi:MAG: hypothetical protein WKG01_36775 [Kofleriaceae bacterium]